jgi:YfiH family protein
MSMELEVPLLRSSTLPPPFEHGFTTRVGGVSEGAYQSLNLGAKWGDHPACVRENRRRFFRAAGLERLFSATQVHAAQCVRIDSRETDSETIARIHADALYSRTADVALGVYTADCLPILLADPRSGALAAVHAGWRGTLVGVVLATVRSLMEAFRCRPGDLSVALGPSIGPCCFEVGPEVAARFDPRFVHAGAGPNGKTTVDLRAANRDQLIRVGVHPAQIDAAVPCTMCDPDRFFSFRRDGRETGQMVSYIIRRTS